MEVLNLILGSSSPNRFFLISECKLYGCRVGEKFPVQDLPNAFFNNHPLTMNYQNFGLKNKKSSWQILDSRAGQNIQSRLSNSRFIHYWVAHVLFLTSSLYLSVGRKHYCVCGVVAFLFFYRMKTESQYEKNSQIIHHF